MEKSSLSSAGEASPLPGPERASACTNDAAFGAADGAAAPAHPSAGEKMQSSASVVVSLEPISQTPRSIPRSGYIGAVMSGTLSYFEYVMVLTPLSPGVWICTGR